MGKGAQELVPAVHLKGNLRHDPCSRLDTPAK